MCESKFLCSQPRFEGQDSPCFFFSFKSVRLLLCVHTALFVKHTPFQPRASPRPSLVLLYATACFPTNPSRSMAERALPWLPPARTEMTTTNTRRGRVRRQQARWDWEAKVQGLGADARGPGGERAAAPKLLWEPTCGPPRLFSAPVLPTYPDSLQIVT